jgi:hypothetical protein
MLTDALAHPPPTLQLCLAAGSLRLACTSSVTHTDAAHAVQLLQLLASYYDWGNVTTVWAWGANGTANPTNFTNAITGPYLVPYNG